MEERSLKRPPRVVEIFDLHENADVLSDSVRKKKPFRIFALLHKAQSFLQRANLPLVHGAQQLVLGPAEGKKKFGLTIEKECP